MKGALVVKSQLKAHCIMGPATDTPVPNIWYRTGQISTLGTPMTNGRFRRYVYETVYWNAILPRDNKWLHYNHATSM